MGYVYFYARGLEGNRHRIYDTSVVSCGYQGVFSQLILSGCTYETEMNLLEPRYPHTSVASDLRVQGPRTSVPTHICPKRLEGATLKHVEKCMFRALWRGWYSGHTPPQGPSGGLQGYLAHKKPPPHRTLQ